MRTIDAIIKEEINEAVNNIIFQILERSAERIKGFIPRIEDYRNQTSVQPIVAFLDKLSYFGEQLVIKLHQCAKDKNLNEANNNGMVTPPNPNPVSALYNGFKRGYLQAKNLFTVPTPSSHNNDFAYTAGSISLYELIYQIYPSLSKKYQNLDQQYNGILAQMNYPRRLLDEVDYVKRSIDQMR